MAMAIHKRGSGTVYLRGATWWVQYFANGRKQESSKSKDKAVAENLLKIRQGEIAAGSYISPDKTTIADLCALVKADYDLRRLRDAKIVSWRIGAHIAPILGSVQASRFGSHQVKRYIERRRADEASDPTINRELSIIRRGFALGRRQDPPLVRHEPSIPKLEEDNARQGFLEPEHYERILAELPENLKALFVVGYHTGARKNELRKIRWEQVDLEAGLIRLTVRQTKGKQARTLPIYGDMERWLRTQEQARRPGNPYVFFGQRNYPVDNHMLGWDEACERAGFPGLLFHDLRRSAVRNMKRAGLGDLEAMRISGHKTRAIFDRYNIVDEADIQNAAGKIDSYLKKRKSGPKLKRVK